MSKLHVDSEEKAFFLFKRVSQKPWYVVALSLVQYIVSAQLHPAGKSAIYVLAQSGCFSVAVKRNEDG